MTATEAQERNVRKGWLEPRPGQPQYPSLPHPSNRPVSWASLAFIAFWLLLGRASVDGSELNVWQAIDAQIDTQLAKLLPGRSTANDYVSSHECRDCHEEQHSSWHRSFHRSMTQAATSANVAGAFDGSTVISDGLDYRVYREGDSFWAEMPDPDVMMYVVQGGRKLPMDQIPRRKLRVVMTTGSHHYQTYWVQSPRYEGLLQTLPLVYLISDQRWLPRGEAFMHGPADQGRFITQWNHHCIRCHSTGGNPGLKEETGLLDTKVGELGIACEACHGPGGRHVELQKLKKRGGADTANDASVDPIINPKRLDHQRSSQVCGQCHGVYVMKDEFAMQYAKEGSLYRPGQDLHRTRYYVQHPAAANAKDRQGDIERNPDFFRERWWEDGQILAGGREYTALSVSSCFTKGDISCLSCHSLHRGDPNDQLKPTLSHSAQCTQCHDAPRYRERIEEHTFHEPGSTGSECLNCHMPHTTYALFSAIRSHQISSPKVTGLASGASPNACNLCHLDQTLDWSQKWLASWYGQTPVELEVREKETSAAVLWTLKGHAAYRAIAAWHFGWEPAREAAGSDWLAPFLAQLLEDPYGVVRYIAGKSLIRLGPGNAEGFDFIASKEHRAENAAMVREKWLATNPSLEADLRKRTLIHPDGTLMEAEIARLLDERDQRSVTIKE